jgi:hypothetical protein
MYNHNDTDGREKMFQNSNSKKNIMPYPVQTDVRLFITIATAAA